MPIGLDAHLPPRREDCMTEVETPALARPRRYPSPAEAPHPVQPAGGHATAWIACGLFLYVFAVYALTSAGRIDIVDGQARFDVAYNWIVNGRPLITDGWIKPFMSIPGRGHLRYSYFGPAASVLAMPLVWIGFYTNTSEFLFSLTSPIFGAAIAPLLFVFYLELGLTRRRALLWAVVSSFATYIWAISNSTFDNAQHAFFTLAAVYFAWLSARRRSARFAALSGLMMGTLFLYQEYFLLLVPALAVITLNWNAEWFVRSRSDARHAHWGQAMQQSWRALRRFLRAAWEAPGEERAYCVRYCAFVAAFGVGVFLSLAYNHLRFGGWLDDGKVRFSAQRGYRLWGNPLAGFLTLLASPGKSVFLYSPTVLLGILGVRRLRRLVPELVAGIATATVLLISFLSCISFAGGDWCWGPRYLAPLLPLWALAFPFAISTITRKRVAVVLIALGVFLQGAALSVETQRFFFERKLHDFFWAEDPWFYFKHSALLSRFGEAWSLKDGLPPTATTFNSIPLPDWTTYTVLGPPRNIDRSLAPIWMRKYQIFYVPRPWPFWVATLDPDLRPITLPAWLAGMAALLALGLCCMKRGFKALEAP